ncbi:MAG: DUF4239 domain-containing protein [Cyanobacteria bacterium SZAS-4]|nr:DUF4239 domain-containing protein [Cyanobacteria bacterium SZAS-4]
MVVGSWIVGIIVVFGGTLGSILGMLWVRKIFHVTKLESHHEVAGYLLSVIGTLYAVLLGLIVVDVQSKYQQAQLMAETEANAAADMFLLGQALAPATRDKLSEGIAEYVDVVLEKEWGSDVPRASFTEGSVVPLRKVWQTLGSYEPVTNREIACYSTALTTLGQLADARRFRVVSTRGGISEILWGVLIVGGICTVLFTYFFGVENAIAHIAMTALVSLCLSLNVMLVVLFSNPYRGDLKIQPDGFRYDQRMIQTLLKERAERKAVEKTATGSKPIVKPAMPPAP